MSLASGARKADGRFLIVSEGEKATALYSQEAQIQVPGPWATGDKHNKEPRGMQGQFREDTRRTETSSLINF